MEGGAGDLLRSGGLGAIVALALAASAFAADAGAATPIKVRDKPLADTSTACAELVAQQTALGSTNYPGAEVEPYTSQLTRPTQTT